MSISDNIKFPGALLCARSLFLYGFVLCAVLIGVALYFEHVQGLEPCPLCAVQRLIIIGIGVISLIAFVHNPGYYIRRIYAAILLLLTVFGIAVAGRHVWLQSLPADKIPDCGPGLEFILQTFSFAEALQLVFAGSGECAELQWSFLGLSIPGWTLLIFVGMLMAEIYLMLSRNNSVGKTQ